MAKVLYITANPKAIEYSASLQVGKSFKEAYKEKNNDEVVEIDLYKYDLPALNYTVMGALGKLMNGVDFNELTVDEQRVIGRRKRILEEFKSADKYIFVVPMWELSYPGVLKEYFDTIVVSKETFKYTEDGKPVGLLKNKKAVYIQASGGVYSNMPEYNFGLNHVNGILNFIGVTDIKNILVEGTALPDNFKASIEKGISEAKLVAGTF